MTVGTESETIEFKESTSEMHSAIEAIAAILNKHPFGVLYFGVRDNGEPKKGGPITDSTKKNVAEAITRDIEPRITPTVEVENFGGIDVIKVTFSGAQRPYSAFGNFLVRVGTTNRKMTRDELLRLARAVDYSSKWEEQDSGATLDDIDDGTLRKYYAEAVACGRLDVGDYGKESLLAAIEVYRDGVVTNAAYSLFGKEAKVGLKLACYATNEKITFTDLNLMKGNVYTLVNEAVTYISNHINWRAEIDRKRVETPEIPIKAIREMVVNAFAHAYYESHPEIEISIHPGMVDIYNPGSFPAELTPEDFVTKRLSSVKRNPLILDALYRCKDVEKSGSGFRRMDALCKAAGVRWEYRKTAYGFSFTFLRSSPKADNVTLDVTKDVTLELLKSNLNETEKMVYQLLLNRPKATKEEISATMGKTTRTIQRALNSLSEKKFILRIGGKRFGYWEILK